MKHPARLRFSYAQGMDHSAKESSVSGLVSVFSKAEAGIDETETLTVRQLLESNGITTVVIGVDSPLPVLAEEIRVAPEDAERARQLIAEALSVGAAGAEEAELDLEAEAESKG